MGLVPGTRSWLAAVRNYAVASNDDEKVQLCDLLDKAWQDVSYLKGQLKYEQELESASDSESASSGSAEAGGRYNGIFSSFKKFFRVK